MMALGLYRTLPRPVSQPLVSSLKITAHDDPVCRPPGSGTHQSGPQDEKVREDRGQHGDGGGNCVGSHAVGVARGQSGVDGRGPRHRSGYLGTGDRDRLEREDPGQGITTKNAYSSSGSPRNRAANVPCGVETPLSSRGCQRVPR